MTTREKIVSHLRIIRTWAAAHAPLLIQGGKADSGKITDWLDEVLDWMKPVPPVHKPEWRENYYVCGNCGGWVTKPRKGVQEGDNYCSRCGREIRWE